MADEKPPPCPDHREVQHRDGKPPWCKSCGWHYGHPSTPPMRVRAAGTVSDADTIPKIY